MNTSMTNTAVRTQETVLTTNKVIRNTYTLLSMTLLFSALTAGVAMTLNLPHPGLLLTLGGYFGLLFATTKFRNALWVIPWGRFSTPIWRCPTAARW
jgi:modulator of FtsH protease